MTDEIELLRSLRPPTGGPDPVFVANERNALMAVIADAKPVTELDPPERPRRRARWTIPVVVVASAATAAAGWAVLRSDPTTTTSVSCGDSVVDSSTGDPVADCAALWLREKGTPAPPLVAYVGPGGGIRVVPADERPPEESTPLPPGFRQETALIELEAELGDVSRGLASGCLGEADARRVVTGHLQRLGLSEWTVTVRTEEPIAGAAGTCPAGAARYVEIIQPEAGQVELVANVRGGFPRDAPPFVELARRLTARLVAGPDAECLSVDQAADLARREAAGLGLIDVVFHVVPPADASVATCARPTTNVAGTVEVTIRAVPR